MNIDRILSRWFSPNDYRFSRNQVIWLLWAIEDLKEGWYPKEPRETGYELEIRSRCFLPVARFEIACQIAAEVEWRVNRTGQDGILLMKEIEVKRWAYLCAGLAGTGGGYKRMRENSIVVLYRPFSEPAYLALTYCTGEQRRVMPYREWRRQWQERHAEMANE